MKVRFIFSLLLSLLTVCTALSQMLWVPGTPVISEINPLSIGVNYGINQPGKVYIAVYNIDITSMPTSAKVKADVLAGPSGNCIVTAVLSVTPPEINTVLNSTLAVQNVNTLHSIIIVAENATGVLMAAPVKLLCTTLQCPHINILNGLVQPEECINKGALAFFHVIADQNPLISGILKGTTWTIDWGDGNMTTYTSVMDNDLPPVVSLNHVYSSVMDCNYLFRARVQNPCGEFIIVEYVAVVHGRDIPSDGDGMLRIINNADGSQMIQVCEGTETTITLRDNSIWNCQNPVLPGGLQPVPNAEPRNIEWLYGRDPAGAISNTITGIVNIAPLGAAPQTSGRFSPVPYGSESLSQPITIPATCRAGEYFRVYLKNWNKCNWEDPEFVFTHIDILVISSPPAPTVPDKIICFGGDRTLTVTSPPVGSIIWYSDPALTNLTGVGNTYTPTQSAPGIYNYWVTEQSNTGLMCMSPPENVTLTILPPVINNTIWANQAICYGTVPSMLTGSIPSGGAGSYTYRWQMSLNNTIWTTIAGAAAPNYPPSALTQSTYYRREVRDNLCGYQYSNSILVTVYPALTPGVIGSSQTICSGTTPSHFTQFTSPFGGTGSYLFQWQYSNDDVSWTNIPGATSAVYASAVISKDTYFRRSVISGACGNVFSNTVLVKVNPVPPKPLISRSGNTLTSNSVADNQWYFEGNPIQGATSQSYIATEKGSYHVVVTQNLCMSAPSDIINISSLTSVNELSSVRKFEIYPNPSQGKLFVRIESYQNDTYTIEIVSNTGMPLWKNDNIQVDGTLTKQIDLSHFHAGSYIVRLKNKTGILRKKLIITG